MDKMFFGINDVGEKVIALPGKKAKCPICGGDLIAKCGDIKIWHWAHKIDMLCDSFGEPESDWHFNWKMEFPPECQEVIIEKFGIKHIADIKTKKWVIELQNSPLEINKIIDREKFYGNMVWVLNGSTIGKGIKKRQIRDKDVITFRWKHPHKSWWSAKKPIYVDFGDKILLIRKVYDNIPCGGWGKLIKRGDFINGFK